jgi:hypothetical protein
MKSVSFTLSGQEVTSPLPLSPTIIYAHDTVGGIIDAVLAPDLSRVYFPIEQGDGNGSWDDTINYVDLTTCSELCTRTVVALYKNVGMGGFSFNSSGSRLYFDRQDRKVSPELRAASFIENQGGTWTQVRDVVTNRDPGFETAKPYITTSADWDFDGDGISTEVMAFGLDDGGYRIYDASTCTAGTAANSCLGASEAFEIRSGSVGWLPGFTTHPSSPLDAPPNLLMSQPGVGVVEIDPDSGNSVRVVLGQSDDSFDSAD